MIKYMGSKSSLLKNGLGQIIADESKNAARIVDLFCGAGSVSWFAAVDLGKRVLACDLQSYATVLAGAVIKRKRAANFEEVEEVWLKQARIMLSKLDKWCEALKLDSTESRTELWQRKAQKLCDSYCEDSSSLIMRCYGGHYFSPTQALSFDAMLETLPNEKDIRELCLAATIMAASCCVASPGHTAQPFKATESAGRYLREAWQRDPFHYARKALEKLCPLYPSLTGDTIIDDANQIAISLKADDLVFIDPPYSAVQYSRFYHVLETMARRSCSAVEGVGRYPPFSDRPKSLYSQKSSSKIAIEDLLSKLSSNGCTVVITFPLKKRTNGLSGKYLEEMARQFFRVKCRLVNSQFSTLGGNSINRAARKSSDELMLILHQQ